MADMELRWSAPAEPLWRQHVDRGIPTGIPTPPRRQHQRNARHWTRRVGVDRHRRRCGSLHTRDTRLTGPATPRHRAPPHNRSTNTHERIGARTRQGRSSHRTPANHPLSEHSTRRSGRHWDRTTGYRCSSPVIAACRVVAGWSREQPSLAGLCAGPDTVVVSQWLERRSLESGCSRGRRVGCYGSSARSMRVTVPASAWLIHKAPPPTAMSDGSCSKTMGPPVTVLVEASIT